MTVSNTRSREIIRFQKRLDAAKENFRGRLSPDGPEVKKLLHDQWT
jgi:hypothetical protein